MKTLHVVAAVAILGTATVVGAVTADAPGGRPPGVSASEWAPISDVLGVVLDQPAPAAGDAAVPGQPNPVGPTDRAIREAATAPANGGINGAVLIPPVSGYLMVKRGNLWQRVILVEPVKGPGVAG